MRPKPDARENRMFVRHFAGGRTRFLLVHGFGAGNTVLPLARELGRSHEVFLPDLPGFGRTPSPAPTLRVGALARALHGWMRATRLAPDVLVATSFGCQVATELVVGEGATPSRLVLISPTFDPSARSVTRTVGRVARTAPHEPFRLWLLELLDVTRVGPLRAWRTLRSALDDDIERRLPHVQVPTLVIHGARGEIVSRLWTERVARLLPDGRFVSLPDAAHAAGYDSARETARTITAFVEG